MRTRCALGAGVVALTFMTAIPWAQAEEMPPLVVVVETSPGVGPEAGEIRRAVGAELHRTVAGPGDAMAGGPSDILLIAVARERIVMSLRERSDERVTRSIPAPPDRPSRLRAVTWLAGNLARDQVTPLLAATAIAVAPETPATSAAAQPATAPPAVRPTPEVAEIELRPAPRPPESADAWLASVALGQALEYGWTRSGPPPDFGFTTQIEALRHRSDGYLWGGAIDFGPRDRHRTGLAVVGGFERRWGSFMFEASAGLGLETVAGTATTTVMSSSLTGQTSTTTVTPSWAPYARLFLSLSHPMTRSWDVELRLGAHAPVTGFLDTSFVASSLGVRLRLP